MNSRVITAVKTFKGNPYDGDTLEASLEAAASITGKRPKRCYTDLGYRGRHTLKSTLIIHPKSSRKNMTQWQRRKRRIALRKRSGIEATISHLKRNYGLNRTYLKGLSGDTIQLLLAAAAYNLALWGREHLLALFLYAQRQIIPSQRHCNQPGSFISTLSEDLSIPLSPISFRQFSF